MYLLSELDLSLPLTNPVIIFSLVLFIILFAPILFNRIKIPYIIGLIAAGVLVGPYGFNLLLRDSSIVLFGTVGLLYIMFTAGLEIDIDEFKKNTSKSVVFGLFTFAVPMMLGIPLAYYLLRFDLASSILLSCIFASHTLLAYPIASRYGIARNKAVTLTIGGTIITDILALLLLAVVVGLAKDELSSAFWIRLLISTAIFGAIVLVGFPLVARWFFKKFDDNISQYIFVLALVFLGSFLAELAGLEAIIGAFIAGLALNRFIPHSSALMNRIEFVGNAFFIPFFLISVGMLVDFRVIFKGWGALELAGFMIVLAVASKYIAAWLTQKSFKLTRDERQIIFGLSTARVGATLAVVLVGYNLIIGETATGEPIRLLNEDVLNGTVLLILVTCSISSFVTEKASQRMSLQLENEESLTDQEEKTMIAIAYPETVTDLLDLGLMMKLKTSTVPLIALNVIAEDAESNGTVLSRKLMEKAVKHASASDQQIQTIIRHDINISNGIIYAVREQNITDLLIGLHHDASESEFIGPIADKLLRSITDTVMIYKSVQPLNTLRRMVVVVTRNAELEPGFAHWFSKLAAVAREAGLSIDFYAYRSTTSELLRLKQIFSVELKLEFKHFENWDDFLMLTGEVKKNDLLVIVSSRKGQLSYQPQVDRLPYYLSRYFQQNSFLIVYPRQLEKGIKMSDVDYVDGSLAETVSAKVATVGKLKNLFRNIRKNRS